MERVVEDVAVHAAPQADSAVGKAIVRIEVAVRIINAVNHVPDDKEVRSEPEIRIAGDENAELAIMELVEEKPGVLRRILSADARADAAAPRRPMVVDVILRHHDVNGLFRPEARLAVAVCDVQAEVDVVGARLSTLSAVDLHAVAGVG